MPETQSVPENNNHKEINVRAGDTFTIDNRPTAVGRKDRENNSYRKINIELPSEVQMFLSRISIEMCLDQMSGKLKVFGKSGDNNAHLVEIYYKDKSGFQYYMDQIGIGGELLAKTSTPIVYISNQGTFVVGFKCVAQSSEGGKGANLTFKVTNEKEDVLPTHLNKSKK